MKPLNFAIIFLFIFLSVLVRAEEQETEAISSIQHFKANKQYSFIDLEAGYSSITTNLSSATSLDFALNYKYALNDKWALAGKVGQGLNMAGFGTLFTALSGGISWAYRGSHIQKKSTSSIDGIQMADITPYTNSAIYFKAMFKQMFFNGTDDVVPLVGTSFSASYQFPSSRRTVFSLGGIFDLASNGDRTLSAFKIFFAAGLWM